MIDIVDATRDNQTTPFKGATMIAGKIFKLTSVVMRTVPVSKEKLQSTEAPMPGTRFMASADVECTNCHRTWFATNSEVGGLRAAGAETRVKCPRCSATELIPNP